MFLSFKYLSHEWKFKEIIRLCISFRVFDTCNTAFKYYKIFPAFSQINAELYTLWSDIFMCIVFSEFYVLLIRYTYRFLRKFIIERFNPGLKIAVICWVHDIKAPFFKDNLVFKAALTFLYNLILEDNNNISTCIEDMLKNEKTMQN